MGKQLLAACMALVVGSACAQALEPVDLDMVGRIREEAFRHSQVMSLLGELTEDIGPRLTASPAMDRANAWSRGKFEAWGLANVHDEALEGFGRGWEFSRARVEMLAPRAFPLHALPKAWTPGTEGAVEGDAVAAKIESLADLEKYRGKLRGKVVFLSDARAYEPGAKPDFQRLDGEGLLALHAFEVPADRKGGNGERLKRYQDRLALAEALNRFLVDEGALASVSISGHDDGVIGVSGGGSRKAGEPVGVPALVMAAEHYNQVMRALDRDQTVRLRVDVDSRFTTPGDRASANTIAEIPGRGPLANEVVMIGAHMDSWHGGTGASDNGAGVAVVMEAMRILDAVGARPRRTIRVALWTGEEQGLLGSADYVARHFAAWPEPTDPEQAKIPAFFRENHGTLQRKPEYERLDAYFNLDNGSGKIRGIYAQENLAAMPVFEAWLKPFADVGATDVVSGNTGSTDHISFDRVGLPGFQFVQDDLDYFSNVHHTDLDTYDHAVAEDLKQAAAIVASVAYDAAMRERPLPRKPLRGD
jgi:hypothetical protein